MDELKWPGNKIRETFLKFFEERGHKIVRSSSLVPANDPTLLFTNAGMNQFKDVFLGLEHRDYNRATSCQKCVRAGGKHNDLENVGFTNRHHTFFEMLGNFSFGDYFKEQAIAYAMELVTSSKWYGIPLDKLYFTVFGGAEVARGTNLDTDAEAAAFWAKVGAPKDRIVPVPGLKENFWAMGDTGPCGPCSEIFYDMGPEASDEGHADCKFPCDCGRYVEIWNLVFMQFNRDANGKLNPLPKPSVDTGMGLERVAAVLQGKISNFDTDLFVPLMEQASMILTGLHPSNNPGAGPSLRIIADHSRAATFLISDGVIPSNEGRGYVLRKILRRAIRHGRLLGYEEPFLQKIVLAVSDLMHEAYPELLQSQQRVSKAVQAEEKQFARTLELGNKNLEGSIYAGMAADANHLFRAGSSRVMSPEEMREVFSDPNASAWLDEMVREEDETRVWDRVADLERFASEKGEQGKINFDRLRRHYTRQQGTTPPSRPELRALANLVRERFGTTWKFSGLSAFKLYDTYGLPRDFIEDAARDAGLDVNWETFEKAMAEQQQRSRASWKGAHKEAASPVYRKLADTFKTEPDFYFGTTTRDCHIEAIVTKNGEVKKLKAGEEAEVVLDRTTIYSESGGQIADTGGLYDNDMTLQVAEVRGAYYPVAGLIAHRIVAKEDLVVGDRVATVADAARRSRIMRNHTGTHLMNAALRNILGTHVKQAGSLNAPDHLRFDFSHFAQLAPEELQEIEQQVNEEILRDLPLHTDIMNIDDALASGALAFFGDKYPEQNVRVVTIDDAAYPRGFYSKELCGGTHVARTGEIGVFKISMEQSVAAGVRRIEALTGDAALAQYQTALGTLRTLAGILNIGEDRVVEAVEKLTQTTKQLEKQLEGLKRKSAVSMADSLLEGARTVKDVRVVAARVPGFDREALRQLADGLRQKMGSGVVFLAAGEDGKVSIITAVTKDLTNRLHAGKMVQELAKFVGGSGGGRPDLAEAGGKDVAGIETAIAQVYPLVERML